MQTVTTIVDHNLKTVQVSNPVPGTGGNIALAAGALALIDVVPGRILIWAEDAGNPLRRHIVVAPVCTAKTGWTTSTIYAAHDLVPYSGRLYRAKTTHTSAATTTPGTGAT